MMEIEFRAFIDDLADFRKRLGSIGAKRKRERKITDYWFCEKSKSSFEEVGQDEVGSWGLRIRKEPGRIELNLKVLAREGDHNAFEEDEVVVSSFPIMRKILESLGYKVFCVIEKTRTEYGYSHCTINLEEIKGWRPAVELEIISDGRVEDHKAYLRDLMARLGIHELIDKSITYLYMKDNALKPIPL